MRGHAWLINERCSARFLGCSASGDLFILNWRTIVTEFIGVSLALRHFHVSPVTFRCRSPGSVLVAITAEERQLRPPLGAVAVLSELDQGGQALIHAGVHGPTWELRAGRTITSSSRRPWRCLLDRGAVDHRDRRRPWRPAAGSSRSADGQADHAVCSSVTSAPTPRTGASLFPRSSGRHHDPAVRGPGHQPGRQVQRRARGGPRAGTAWPSSTAWLSPSCCSTPPSSARPRSPL